MTQVRVPEFEFEVAEISSSHSSAAYTPTIKRFARNLRLESIESPTGSHISTDIVDIEIAPMVVDEMSDAAEVCLEKTERQRALARARNAARRNTATPEQIEQRRALDKERKAAKRINATPEEIEQQRALDKERKAAKRINATPEEIEQRRALDKERKVAKRTNATPEEIEQQRILNRKRNAARRVSATPEEIEQRRALDKERKIAKRTNATPEEIEQQRILNRERNAARRVSAAPEEIEQRRALTREETNIENTDNSKNKLSRARSNKNLEVEWPKPVEFEHKARCLKDFVLNMSMNCLGEDVCSICNIRSFKRERRCVPLAKIPSIELLKVHEDLRGIIPGKQITSHSLSTSGHETVIDFDRLVEEYDKNKGWIFLMFNID